MTTGKPNDVWEAGPAYEAYVGRWSRVVAREFLAWLQIEPDRRWLDVGCGTGMLSAAALDSAAPTALVGIDPSNGFLDLARSSTLDPRALFQQGEAGSLPFSDDTFDVVISGLVLNFVPDAVGAVAEAVRVTRPGGIVAAYVWDYAGGMQMLRYCWDAAVTLDSTIADLDQGRRFPLCEPDALRTLFDSAGLRAVETRAIDIPMVFADFGDYWQPFLGGQGSAPSYIAKLDDKQRDALRDQIRSALPTAPDGSISLTGRAWAVRGDVG